MKKTVVFCLFCVIFTLISASVCFAQWGVIDDDESGELEDIDGVDDPYYIDPGMGGYDNNAAAPAPPSGSEDAAAAKTAAEEAAASAAKAVEAAEAAQAAATAAEAASAAASGSAPPAAPSAPPQAPVRIVIPMMANPAYPPPPPAPPSYPAQPYPAPPSYPAPPVYRQPPPMSVIPAMPNPYSSGLYRVQVGAFGSSGLAQQCFSRLLSAGFSPFYEPYGNVYRVVLPGIRAADMAAVVQRLAAAGFYEIWIREER